jgi:hypothetical protein
MLDERIIERLNQPLRFAWRAETIQAAAAAREMPAAQVKPEPPTFIGFAVANARGVIFVSGDDAGNAETAQFWARRYGVRFGRVQPVRIPNDYGDEFSTLTAYVRKGGDSYRWRNVGIRLMDGTPLAL